jgi:vacuolar protein sorting-associated protein 53
LKDKLTFQPERDLFVKCAFSLYLFSFSLNSSYLCLSVISSAIQIQIRELEHGVEPALSTLARTSWAAQRQVSGPSPYVGDLASALDLAADAVKQRVQQKKYLRNFFDKAAG